MPLRRSRRLVMPATVVVLVVACAGTPPPDLAERSIILVTLDTTRADHVGAFGGESVPTPNLDRVARQGVIFEQAFSVAPLTLPAHASILTGRFPASHGARHNGLYRLRDSEITLAEHLRALGFSTAGFVGSFVLDRGFGTEQGFDLYDDIETDDRGVPGSFSDAQRTADEVNARVLEWLEDRPPAGRFFLWVHYYDPHDPYDPPEKAGRRLHGEGYDREISYVDACLGELLDHLERDGILERSVLIIVGDHGEGLGEHRERTHGIFLYDSSMHVPMMIRSPGLVPEGRRVAGPVSIVDLAPTVLDLLGLPPLPDAQGRSLVARIEGDTGAGDEMVFGETMMPREEFGWSALRMVRDARYKLIDAPREELYDLLEDPQELHNLATIEESRTLAMSRELESWMRATTSERSADARRELSEEELERLRSLGYLGGDVAERGGGAAAIDPKDALDDQARLQEAEDLLRSGQREAVVPILREVLAQNPAHPLASALLINLLIELERLPEAETVANRTIDAVLASPLPDSSFLRQTRLRLAQVYHLEGREEDAETAYREALDGWVADDSTTALIGLTTSVSCETARDVFRDLLMTDPAHPVALAGLLEFAIDDDDAEASARAAARIVSAGRSPSIPAPLLVEGGRRLLAAGDAPGAVEMFDRAIETMGRQPDLLGYLGTALLSAGRLEEARDALEQAKRLRPDDPRAYLYLGNIDLLQDREQEARAHYDEALRLDPGSSEPLDNLGIWLISKNRRREAIEALEQALERDPDDVKARELLRRLGTSESRSADGTP